MFLLINTERRKDIMQDQKTENLNVIDDGRYDPLDHNTRHGSYAAMNAETNEIIDFLWDIFQT